MRTYASSRDKRKSFYSKSDLQMFLLISGGNIGTPKRYQDGVSIQSSAKGAENVSANNSETIRATKLKTWGLNKLFIY